MLKRISKSLGSAATAAISVHVVVSALQNTPDSFNLDLRPFTFGWPLPGWRFFAPNPGIQNVHLLARTRTFDIEVNSVGEWQDVTPNISHSWLNVVWNPKSRGPKALFDTVQQLSVMRGNYSSFGYITQSEPYELVADATRGFIGDTDDSEFQFLLMNYFPSEIEGKRMSPVLVSEWLPISAREIDS